MICVLFVSLHEYVVFGNDVCAGGAPLDCSELVLWHCHFETSKRSGGLLQLDMLFSLPTIFLTLTKSR